jgi:putative flippase GtrA
MVRALYERFRQIIHEFAKFGVIGVIGLIITNVGYALLHSNLGMGPVKATTVATIVATCVTYVGNRYWSFKHRERTNVAREGTIFFVLNGIGLGIQDAVVAINYYLLGLGGNKLAEFLALNCGIALATLFRFWSYRKFVWAAPSGDGGTEAPADETTPPDRPQGTGKRFRPVTIAPPGSAEHTNGNGDSAADRASRAAENGSYSRR